ncbi:N-acetyl-beta-glucosaminyl-glycoprotein 4-beta-N-acetylgalactosaminyltransferase 1 isoform X1 [Tachyglossus aculeatus]|uniref:N-acetyl-beta-glucosaminyl-glycoprotein 4-beta-N-acetylgalactosaminyltransferase 1 isoform X1 n=1 Tax=Tachyglossus aculeatus TaxID=9261 RepID=UPI0018F3588F|nr:N-acetyl-beta-glucosaminyl-glycoprotein 4-beta-N-acetylgalactosaminyltransferase 1 isoform X1 [Tachyglossus aculeatus]
MLRFPVKKVRKQLKLLLLVALVTCAAWLTYLHIGLGRQGRALPRRLGYATDGEKPGTVTDAGRRGAGVPAVTSSRQAEDSSESREDDQAMEGPGLSVRLPRKPPPLNLTRHAAPWHEEYRGKANLHVFEDWCGGAVSHLRRNLHFPLFPHTRTTVKKLAVSPKWKNYGLRVFGYIHPFRDGDFQFSVASDDNSELWLSSDESPAGARLVAFVGKAGSEWTAPGEFTKFSSQVSKPMRLMSSRRYYFELLHKQDDHGSDHVEVGWRAFLPSLKFEVIDSPYLSLYTDETTLKMNDVSHVPQSLASHAGGHRWGPPREEHGADMLKPDPRDTFFLTPRVEPSHVENVLVPCAYAPTYVVKDFPIARYQGLQFVYLSFVYPNDFTRLTHMETENKCFYRESPLYLEKFGFYKYMKMDEEEEEEEEEGETQRRAFLFLNPDNFLEEEEEEGAEDSPEPTEGPASSKEQTPAATPGTGLGGLEEGAPSPSRPGSSEERALRGHLSKGAAPTGVSPGGAPAPPPPPRSLSWSRRDARDPLSRLPLLSVPLFPGRAKLPRAALPLPPRDRPRDQAEPREKMPKATEKVYVTRLQPGHRRGPPAPAFPGPFLYPKPLALRPRPPRAPRPASHLSRGPDRRPPASGSPGPGRGQPEQAGFPGPQTQAADPRPAGHRARATVPASEAALTEEARTASFLAVSEGTNSRPGGEGKPPGEEEEEEEEDEGEEELSDYSYEAAGELRPGWPEDAINWQRTFSVGAVDFELLRSDWNDLRCNVSGNLQLGEPEVVDLVAQYLEKLNDKNGGIYTLLRIVNVEKRRDTARGNRYLMELELLERGRRKVRLSEYVYLLLPHSRGSDSAEDSPTGPAPTLSPRPSPDGKAVLCRPLRLGWRQDVMVHFVVPVKNQARWVQQFISDMAELFAHTGDPHFSVVLVDFDSDDMDVEQALRDARLPRYQYLKRTGNFERSAGLQAGVDSIEDQGSIVFLCDLHIHFPANILDSVRKHCVEGRLAYAPIVMRLSCGSSPQEPNGYWEVNGFGLFGIYKSDFDRVGGMNTEEFRDRWGGEDWELLDRVLQSGLEVERLRLRNFYHYYHSKRGMWNAHSKKTPRD